jgi:hypothetical protein
MAPLGGDLAGRHWCWSPLIDPANSRPWAIGPKLPRIGWSRYEISLRYRDILAVGSIKHALQRRQNGGAVDGSFLDVRTVLQADEVNTSAIRAT